MGLWNTLFGTPKPPYVPGTLGFNESILVLHSENPLQIELAPIYGIIIDGTITNERQAMADNGEDCYFVEGIDGMANVPHPREIRIDAKAPRISGNIWHSGTLEARTLDITVRRQMTIKTNRKAEVYAPHFTKVMNKYVLTELLPERLRAEYDQIELTPEQINGHWEAIEEATKNLPILTIKATSARIQYMSQNL
jgi:hypothetical protein